MFTPWHVQFLGGFCLTRGSEIKNRLRSQKAVSLLAFLCAHAGQDIGREELAARFWPEDSLEQGRNSLRVVLSTLRTALDCADSPCFSATRTHIHLHPDALRSDAAEFERAARRRDAAALTLYTGDFLPGIYDEWVLAERARLEALRDEIAGGIPFIAPAAVASFPRVSPNNLPLTLNRFFGRESEQNEIKSRITDGTTRVVTLVGAGGMGKTRLSVEAARRLARDDSFPGGVWWIALSGVRHEAEFPALLPTFLRDAMGLTASPDARPADQIQAHLQNQKVLFVLDNLEQISGGAAVALLPLLALLPNAVFLATSRVPLDIPGEVQIGVSVLPLPRWEISRGDAAQNPAVALFCDRAREADTEFVLTESNHGDVLALVRDLNGVPLALELAAAWANVLTPRRMREEIAHREDSFPQAKETSHREVRHRSLIAVVAWSFDLLDDDLRTAWLAITVFPADFTAQAAGFVANRTGLGWLGQLRRVSFLLTKTTLDGDIRFSVPDALCPFVQTIRTTDQRIVANKRLAAFFTTQITDTEPKALRQVAMREQENLLRTQQVLESNAKRESADALVTLVRKLWRPLYQVGLWDRAEAFLHSGIRCTNEDLPRHAAEAADFYRGMGSMAFYRGRYGASYEAMTRGLQITETHALPGLAALLRGDLGAIALAAGRVAESIELLHQSIEEAEAVGGQNVRSGDRAEMWLNLAEAYARNGEYDIAESWARKASCLPDLPAGTGALCQSGIGMIYLRRGAVRDAEAYLSEAFRQYREADMTARDGELFGFFARLYLPENRPLACLCLRESLRRARAVEDRDQFLVILELFAQLAAPSDLSQARLFWHQAQRLREEMGVTVCPAEQDTHQQFANLLATPPEAVMPSLSETLAEAVRYADAQPAPDDAHPLTQFLTVEQVG